MTSAISACRKLGTIPHPEHGNYFASKQLFSGSKLCLFIIFFLSSCGVTIVVFYATVSDRTGRLSVCDGRHSEAHFLHDFSSGDGHARSHRRHRAHEPKEAKRGVICSLCGVYVCIVRELRPSLEEFIVCNCSVSGAYTHGSFWLAGLMKAQQK